MALRRKKNSGIEADETAVPENDGTFDEIVGAEPEPAAEKGASKGSGGAASSAATEACG
jgi:hypothetical protein